MREITYMNIFKCKILLPLLLIFGFNQCDRGTCIESFKFENNASKNIAIHTLPWECQNCFDDTNVILPYSHIEDDFGRGKPTSYEEVPTFLMFDSLAVVFNETDTTVHYRDSLKGNYQRSLFNIDAYDLNNCTYTYSFTEDDYKNAQKF